MEKNYELRIVSTKFEVREEGEEKNPKIVGYAAVFDDPAPETWGFIEKIAPGAFTDALKTSDVRALINHDPNLILGRNKAGTLKLKEDEKGLYMEIDPPNTSYANDLIISMDRGDIDQCSFQFMVEVEEWDDSGDVPVRTIVKVKELRDVSVVTFPWYPNTNANVRSKEDVIKEYRQNKASKAADELDLLKRKIQLRERMIFNG